MKKTSLLLSLAILMLTQANAQQALFYDDYISGNMDGWKLRMDQLEASGPNGSVQDHIYELSLAQYGYIAWCMSTDKKKNAAEYVEKAGQNVDRLLDLDPDWPRAYSLRAAIYGFEAGQMPVKAPVLGTRAIRMVNQALSDDPTDPYIWMERGNIDLYKPKIFGGNKHEAIKYYLKAIELFETDTCMINKNWLYLNTLAGLASAYVKTNRIKRANRTYLKILEVEPEFTWIRDDVYPAFRRKYMEAGES